MPDPSATADFSDAPVPVTLEYAAAASRPFPWLIWIIVAVAVALRLAFAATRSVGPDALAALPDQLEYVAIAESIRAGTGIHCEDRTFNDDVRAYRMPAYPAFIALCGNRLRLVQGVQAALDGTAALAVFLIGRRVHRNDVALLAAIAVAINPYLIYFSALLLSETLFTAMLAWGVWAMLSPRAGIRVGGIVILLASVFVRPSAVGLGVLAAASVFFAGATPLVRWRNGVIAALAAGLALLAMLAPWAIRNAGATGHYVWLTTNDGFTAYDAFNPRADGSSDQAWFREELHLHDEVGRSNQLSAMARDYAEHHPGRVLTLAFAKLKRFWSPVPLSADFGGRWLYLIVGGAYCIPLFISAVIGVVRGGLGIQMTLTLLLPALYFTAVHSLAVGSLRYRVPCDVPLTVLAAAGVASLARPKAAA